MKFLAAKRYAKALFEAALENEVLEETMQDLNKFVSVFQISSILSIHLDNVEIPIDQRVGLVDSICELLKCHKMVRGFLQLLVTRGRIFACPQIAKSYTDYAAKALNFTNAKVFIADEAIKQQVNKDISDALEQILKKPAKCEIHVDRDLIGGIVLQIGDNILDASVKGRIEQLREVMMIR